MLYLRFLRTMVFGEEASRLISRSTPINVFGVHWLFLFIYGVSVSGPTSLNHTNLDMLIVQKEIIKPMGNTVSFVLLLEL